MADEVIPLFPVSRPKPEPDIDPGYILLPRKLEPPVIREEEPPRPRDETDSIDSRRNSAKGKSTQRIPL